jgi:hypothetical protein
MIITSITSFIISIITINTITHHLHAFVLSFALVVLSLVLLLALA